MSEKLWGENIEKNAEEENKPVQDISEQFLEMQSSDFSDFLFDIYLNDLSAGGPIRTLMIEVDWQDDLMAKRLKAFLESSEDGQERKATIRATKEQYESDPNPFASGVKWREVY